MADDKKIVPPEEGIKHGYIGSVQDDTPNEDYQVTGKATQEATEQPGDQPPPDEAEPKPAAKPARKSGGSQ